MNIVMMKMFIAILDGHYIDINALYQDSPNVLFFL